MDIPAAAASGDAMALNHALICRLAEVMFDPSLSARDLNTVAFRLLDLVRQAREAAEGPRPVGRRRRTQLAAVSED